MESKLNIYYVAAKETMQAGFVDKDNGLWWCNYGGTNLVQKERMSLIKRRKPMTQKTLK
jgi:hypothetical protein